MNNSIGFIVIVGYEKPTEEPTEYLVVLVPPLGGRFGHVPVQVADSTRRAARLSDRWSFAQAQ